MSSRRIDPRSSQGASAVEYALLISGFAAVLVLAVFTIGRVAGAQIAKGGNCLTSKVCTEVAAPTVAPSASATPTPSASSAAPVASPTPSSTRSSSSGSGNSGSGNNGRTGSGSNSGSNNNGNNDD